jgi:FkbM family methyltransferase
MLTPSSKIFDILERAFVWVFNREPIEFYALRKLKSLLFYKRKVAPAHVNIFKKYIHKGDLVIDVGANAGHYSTKFLRLGARVIAFEPGTVFRQLYARHGGNSRIELHCEALGRDIEWVNLYEFAGDGWSTASDKAPTISKVIIKHKVPCWTLDWFELKPDFIKIDTEGMDLNVLLGAEETLKKYKPIVLAECNMTRLKDFGQTKEDMLTYMSGLGYRYKVLENLDWCQDILFIPEEK